MTGLDYESREERHTPPWERPGAVRRDCEPHRGPLLLWLGGAGWVCGLTSLGLVAPAFLGLALGLTTQVLARRDLAKMEAGLMDPEGAGLVRKASGYGAVGALLSLVGLLTPVCAAVLLLARA